MELPYISIRKQLVETTHNPMRTLQLESHKDTFNSPVVRSMQHVSNLPRLGFVPCLTAFHLSCSKRTQTLSDLIQRVLLVISTHPRKNYRVPCELEIRIPRRHRISQGIRIFWIKATSRAATLYGLKKATGVGPNDIQAFLESWTENAHWAQTVGLDALDNATPKVKDCLLDLGAFPEDSEIQVTALIDMWAELYDLDEEMSCIAKLYELNNRSLALLQGDMRLEVVQEAIDYNRYVVRQHDLLRELAIYNSKRDPMEHRERLIIEICGNNVPKWWREQKYPYINARLVSISTDGEFSVKLPNMELPKAEVLVLNSQSETSYALPEFVERMHKLKMLLVINYTSCAKLDNFHLLGSLSNLRSLRLDGIDLSSITKSPVQLKNLHKLYLRECGRDLKLSHIIFPNLKEIVFESCSFWELRGVFCELIHLTKLKITSRSWLSGLSEAFANLVNLETLTLDVCLLEIPESIGNLRKLKLLKINNDRDLKKLPEQMGMLKCLRHLIIEGCSWLSALPESIGNLVNLEVLSLRYCTSLSELPESIRNLQKLNILDMYRCIGIEELPENFGKLKSLMKLQMVGCYALRKLPESVSDLEQLEQVICVDWDATHLWTPLLPTLKNLRIVVREGSKSFVPPCPTSPQVRKVQLLVDAFESVLSLHKLVRAAGVD
ncbi:hypothetical protein ACLB2K_061655 [Fragaria x ananassa]